MSSVFDYTRPDSQGRSVEPLPVEKFDLDGFAEYAAEKDAACGLFLSQKSGILVHRRFRVPEVFAAGCSDEKLSLSLQLSALQQSRRYAMDVPNFLEPWYGIGAVAGAYGAEYIWNGSQAPATKPLFRSVEEALEADPKPIEETVIGRRTLGMIEYFLDATKGRVPMSLSDVQSPLNAASSLVDADEFLILSMDRPDLIQKLLARVTELSLSFFHKQAEMIGDQLVRPGHGFASSRRFTGIGVSDDNSVMLSPQSYSEICTASMEKFGREFGGIVFHSCGNWAVRIPAVKALQGLVAVDGAFTVETDPDANPAEPFREAFKGSPVYVNARMVGSHQVVLDTVKKLRDPKMKMIVVTYAETPEDQRSLYEEIHSLA